MSQEMFEYLKANNADYPTIIFKKITYQIPRLGLCYIIKYYKSKNLMTPATPIYNTFSFITPDGNISNIYPDLLKSGSSLMYSFGCDYFVVDGINERCQFYWRKNARDYQVVPVFYKQSEMGEINSLIGSSALIY